MFLNKAKFIVFYFKRTLTKWNKWIIEAILYAFSHFSRVSRNFCERFCICFKNSRWYLRETCSKFSRVLQDFCKTGKTIKHRIMRNLKSRKSHATRCYRRNNKILAAKFCCMSEHWSWKAAVQHNYNQVNSQRNPCVSPKNQPSYSPKYSFPFQNCMSTSTKHSKLLHVRRSCEFVKPILNVSCWVNFPCKFHATLNFIQNYNMLSYIWLFLVGVFSVTWCLVWCTWKRFWNVSIR